MNPKIAVTGHFRYHVPLMKVRVGIGDAAREIDVDLGLDGRARVAIDGVQTEVDLVRVDGGFHLLLDGRGYDVLVGGKGEERTAAVGAERVLLQVTADKPGARKKGATGKSGAASKELKSPMPGRVIKVLCAVGDEVPADTTLMIVEAMKMENELRVPVAVKIQRVEVTEGSSVESGAVLVRFE